MELDKKDNVGILLLKLSPMFLIIAIIFAGFDVLAAAPIAIVYAAIICKLTTKTTFNEIVQSGLENLNSASIIMFIMMMAYIVATFYTTTGVGASVIVLALKLGVSGRSVAVVAFVSTCIISMATGTSWGSFATTIPIFIWLSHLVGGDIGLTLGACAGGAIFGDNVALISDTTVMSCGMQNVEVADRFNRQSVWSFSCLGIAAICYYLAGLFGGLPSGSVDAKDVISNLPPEVWTALEENRPSAIELLNQVQDGNIPFFMILPLILIITLAIMHFPTLLCLAAGIASSVILGAFIGTVPSFESFINQMYDAIVDCGSFAIVLILWIMAFGGVMRKMDAFAPLARLFIRISKKVRHLMVCNFLLSIAGNLMLADDNACIVTLGPIMREIVEGSVEGSDKDMYELRCRNAVFGDAVSTLTGVLIPWHCIAVFFFAIASAVYPIAEFTPWDMISHNYFAWISIISLFLLSITGLDRFVPRFGIPREPDVMLKKNLVNQSN